MSEVDDLIAAIRTAGRAAWPALEVTDDELRRMAGELAAGDRPAHLADLYLVAGCLAGKPAAFAAFDASQMTVVERTVRKLGGTADELDEVKQHVRTTALVAAPGARPGLATYRGDGSLGSWIRVVAVRETYRRLRARGETPMATDDQMFAMMTDQPDPETGTMKASYREQFRSAFRTAMDALPRRERTALRLNAIDGLSIDAIGKMFGVHRATAARWLANARDSLLQGTRKGMMTVLGLERGDVDSVLRLIESRLDVSIASGSRQR